MTLVVYQLTKCMPSLWTPLDQALNQNGDSNLDYQVTGSILRLKKKLNGYSFISRPMEIKNSKVKTQDIKRFKMDLTNVKEMDYIVNSLQLKQVEIEPSVRKEPRQSYLLTGKKETSWGMPNQVKQFKIIY